MEKYVDNDVFVFDCVLKCDLSRINDITIYTKPFPSEGFVSTDEELDAVIEEHKIVDGEKRDEPVG